MGAGQRNIVGLVTGQAIIKTAAEPFCAVTGIVGGVQADMQEGQQGDLIVRGKINRTAGGGQKACPAENHSFGSR